VTRAERLHRVRPYLACPGCRSELADAGAALACTSCGRSYAVRDGRIYFREPMAAEDALDTVKGRLKRALGPLYYTVGVQVLGPNFPFDYRGKILAHVDPASTLVIDLGAGNRRVSDAIVTLDAGAYDAVDIVADLTALPFKSGSIACFASRSVLEHVPDLPIAIAEIQRCTRPGGLSIHYTPFLFPYHASPHDYQRFTHTGFARLFADWRLVEQYNTSGPVSLALILLAETGATVLSGGVESIKPYVYLLCCLVLFPFKVLDWPFIGRPSMMGLAATMVTVVRKRDA